MQYTLSNGVDRASLVGFTLDSLPIYPRLVDGFPLDFRRSRRSWIFTFSKCRPRETPRGRSLTTPTMRTTANCPWKAAILVDEDGRAVLTDFGSCSVIWNPEDIPQQIIRWCAPEVLGSDKVSGTRPTYASDVFSFGMVILEVGSNG